MAVDLLSEKEVALAPLSAQSFHSATYELFFFGIKVRSFYSVNDGVIFYIVIT
jgi:hypothetical protein